MAGDWRPCDQCGGACVADATSCLAHAGDQEQDTALGQFSETGRLDVRGVVISEPLRMKIMKAAPCDDDDQPIFAYALFGGATFEGEAVFVGHRP